MLAVCVAEVISKLLVSMNKELFLKRRAQLEGLVEFRGGLLLLVHLIHEEEGVLDLKRSACRELLYTSAVHVLGML
jgi:hypothetical protein